MGTTMDRLSTGIMIALAAVLMSGGFLGDALADELGVKAPQAVASVKSPVPVANGLRSERVLSLLLTLEALRAAPVLLDTRKV
jgi:hypothetical protein